MKNTIYTQKLEKIYQKKEEKERVLKIILTFQGQCDQVDFVLTTFDSLTNFLSFPENTIKFQKLTENSQKL